MILAPSHDRYAASLTFQHDYCHGLHCRSVHACWDCFQDKIMALSDVNAALDAEAHEARAARSRLQQETVKVQQQVEVLESHNKWLEQELAARTEAAQQERRAVSAQVGTGASVASGVQMW